MNLKIFAILDTKANIFNQPFFMRSTGEAVRAFADLTNDPQSMLFKHPDDFRLFHIGEYDQELAQFNTLPKPEPIGSAAEFKRPTPNLQQLQLIPPQENAS